VKLLWKKISRITKKPRRGDIPLQLWLIKNVIPTGLIRITTFGANCYSIWYYFLYLHL